MASFSAFVPFSAAEFLPSSALNISKFLFFLGCPPPSKWFTSWLGVTYRSMIPEPVATVFFECTHSTEGFRTCGVIRCDSPPQLSAELTCALAGTKSRYSNRASVFHCVNEPRANHIFSHRALNAQCHARIYVVVLYDSVLRSRVGIYDGIRSVIHDLRIGQGGRPPPCAYGEVVDGDQPKRVYGGAISSKHGFQVFSWVMSLGSRTSIS